MNMKNFIFIILSCLFIKSCSLNGLKIETGHYYHSSYDVFHDLYLSIDSSFIYIYQEGLSGDTIKGKWTNKGTKLFLVPFEESPFHSVFGHNKNNVYQITVLYSLLKQPLPSAVICTYLKDSLIGTNFTDSSGKAVISNKIDSCFVKMIGFKQYGFKINEEGCNIEVLLPDDVNYDFMKSGWKIQKDRIKYSNKFVLKKID